MFKWIAVNKNGVSIEGRSTKASALAVPNAVAVAFKDDLPEYEHWIATEFNGDRAVGFVEDVKARDAALLAKAEASRKSAYQAEADPLFFKWQAGEGTQEEWLAKREEIRQRYPK